jgi:hypothetical protein
MDRPEQQRAQATQTMSQLFAALAKQMEAPSASEESRQQEEAVRYTRAEFLRSVLFGNEKEPSALDNPARQLSPRQAAYARLARAHQDVEKAEEDELRQRSLGNG